MLLIVLGVGVDEREREDRECLGLGDPGRERDLVFDPLALVELGDAVGVRAGYEVTEEGCEEEVALWLDELIEVEATVDETATDELLGVAYD